MPKTEAANAGEPETSPFYLVWNERGRTPTVKQPSFKRAMAEASRLASENIGTFFVLAVVGTAALTNLEKTEFRFDPSGDPPEPNCPGCDLPADACDCVPF